MIKLSTFTKLNTTTKTKYTVHGGAADKIDILDRYEATLKELYGESACVEFVEGE